MCVRDTIRNTVSIGGSLVSVIATIAITSDAYFSAVIGLFMYNILLVSLRPEVVESFFDGVSPKNEVLLTITFSFSLAQFINLPEENFKLGVIHSLMVLLAYHVGLSTGILSNNNKND